VEFEDEDTAQKCIAMMNGKDLKGRSLRVNEAENRPPRPAGGGPGGAPYRPSFGRGPGGPPPSFADSMPFDDRGRPFKSKGSRRNIRKRKRGFDDD
jgi:RNA recognition motif-containing protein